MWHLINNELKVMIDPLLFAFKQRIEEQVRLVSTLQHYVDSTEPKLCKVTFFYPKYTEKILDSRRAFMPDDKVFDLHEAPKKIIETIKIPPELLDKSEDIKNFQKVTNESISLAVEKKCAFFVTALSFPEETIRSIKEDHGLQIVTYEQLTEKIEIFLQGFYNYFKFSIPIYGIDSPDMALKMTDDFIMKSLQPYEYLIKEHSDSDELKELARSFVHNRYPMLLNAKDMVYFFKIQQHIDSIERSINKVNARFHSYIMYHLNFYYYLLYGATDHLAWLVNHSLSLGFDIEKDGMKVGLKISKKNNGRKKFLQKIQETDKELYEYLTSKEVQEWLHYLSVARNKAAHRELMAAGPLIFETEESKISDEEIDKIIYADHLPIESDISHMFTNEQIEAKKQQDRYFYRLSKMKATMEHIEVMKNKDGAQEYFNPVDRIEIDLKHIREMTGKIVESYSRKLTVQK